MPGENLNPFLTDPNGQEHMLVNQENIIGRTLECDVVISSKSVSREHACVKRKGRRWFVEDKGSTNGTFLNEERVTGTLEIRDGDCLLVGEVSFIFHDPDSTVSRNPQPDLDFDQVAGIVRLNRKVVSLSSKEYQLLSYLYGRRGQVCSKDEIGRAVWPEYESGGVFDYQIENLVHRLRMQLEMNASEPQLLLTVRGLGYKLIA